MPPTLPTIEDALSRKDWPCVEVILRQALRQNDIATAQRIGAGIGDALNDAWGEAAKDTTLWDHRPLHKVIRDKAVDADLRSFELDDAELTFSMIRQIDAFCMAALGECFNDPDFKWSE